MTFPSADLCHFELRKPTKIHRSLDKQIDTLIGKYKARKSLLNQFVKQASQVQTLIEEYVPNLQLSLEQQIAQCKQDFININQLSSSSVVDALSLLAIASFKVLGLKPHKVQLIAILALQKGYILEMDTGEGKTLVAGLAAILFSYSSRPCHVLTVNDYLAQRDREFIEPLINFCGLTCATIMGDQPPETRKKSYQADIVYASTHELLADFLRDKIKLKNCKNLSQLVLKNARQRNPISLVTRGIHSVIVDEIDSILIDQSVSPLIIAEQTENKLLEEGVTKAKALVDFLLIDLHYNLDHEHRSINFTKEGLALISKLSPTLPLIWQHQSRRFELIEQAISAREYFIIDQHYIVEDEKIIIVDEFSGRKMPDRSWSLGLHQAIEAKELVPVTMPNKTLERMSLQHFFRLFSRVSGISGTVIEAGNELWHIYKLTILKVPRNKVSQRQYDKTQLFNSKILKWQFIVNIIIEKNKIGQPLLIGTRTIEESETLAQHLQKKGLHYQLLNARYSEMEANIISSAGHYGNITIATNMAGRGTDIKIDDKSDELGGLFVIITELHDSSRIDRQLIGRCARQGEKGAAQYVLSLEDQLFQDHLPNRFIGFLKYSLNWPTISHLAMLSFKYAQSKAEKKSYKQRQQVLNNDISLRKSLSFNKE
ncbi:MAG: DEAD/DEAH box helicase [Oceanospirillaceae bacterium]